MLLDQAIVRLTDIKCALIIEVNGWMGFCGIFWVEPTYAFK